MLRSRYLRFADGRPDRHQIASLWLAGLEQIARTEEVLIAVAEAAAAVAWWSEWRRAVERLWVSAWTLVAENLGVDPSASFLGSSRGFLSDDSIFT